MFQYVGNSEDWPSNSICIVMKETQFLCVTLDPVLELILKTRLASKICLGSKVCATATWLHLLCWTIYFLKKLAMLGTFACVLCLSHLYPEAAPCPSGRNTLLPSLFPSISPASSMYWELGLGSKLIPIPSVLTQERKDEKADVFSLINKNTIFYYKVSPKRWHSYYIMQLLMVWS